MYTVSLAAARVNVEMTQDDTAKALHVSKSTVVNWEKGKIQPSIIALKALCDLYKVPFDCLRLPKIST